MNLLILAALAFGCVLVLWLAQSIALLAAGERVAWPLRTRSCDPLVKWTRRVFVQLTWAALLAGYPAATGSSPWTYFAQAFPDCDWTGILGRFAVCLAAMSAGYAIEIAFGWVRWEPMSDRRLLSRKLIRRILLAVPLAVMEEAVFRGLLLEQLDRAVARASGGWIAAVVISSIVFSLLHFVRPDDGRPFWQPAAGFFVVGVACGSAYVLSGHALWLPVTIHAAGILVSETARLLTVNRGPRLWAGYQTYPHCGLLGATVLIVLTAMLVW